MRPQTSHIWRDYYELTKPRIVMLMLLTALIGMLLAPSDHFPWQTLLLATLGIGLCASAGGVANQLIDQRLDAKMGRTQSRPLPSGRISSWRAIVFACTLAISGTLILATYINLLTTWLTLATLIGYAFIYTVFLKRATPQNIVIGGLSGAMPPLLGWTAVSGSIQYPGLLLVMIIFAWTPPHFWALSIARHEEYAKADIPMLPVTHGIPYTKLNILLYTLLLFSTSLLPFVIDMSGVIYLVAAIILGSIFLYWAIRLYYSNSPKTAMSTFRYSILYLMLLFLFLLIDRVFPLLT